MYDAGKKGETYAGNYISQQSSVVGMSSVARIYGPVNENERRGWVNKNSSPYGLQRIYGKSNPLPLYLL